MSKCGLEFDFIAPIGGSGTNDHSALINRDLPDQHPIESITGLREELDKLTPKAFDTVSKISDFLYEAKYKESDYDYAYDFMEERYKEVLTPFACSAVYKDGMFGKNFDWLYNWCVDFIVHSEGSGYKSVGTAGSISTLTKQFMEEGIYDEIFKIVPFVINEGINERGLFVGINVVPSGDTRGGQPFSTPTTGTNPQLTSRPMCSIMLPKYLLDTCGTADEAVTLVSEGINVYCPHTENLDEEMHLFVGDANKQYIVEFINNTTVVIDVTDNYPWMTNYYRAGAEFDYDGKVVWQSLTDHATGTTRSDIIAENYDSIEDITDMQDLMFNKLKFTNAYELSWLDEFTGNYETYGDLTIGDAYEHPEKFDALMLRVRELYRNRDRNNPITWHTEHSCVYDVPNKKLSVMVQETGEAYETNLRGDLIADHSQLANRDKPDQHPMSAITGLVEALQTYTYVQHSASERWVIEHDLGKHPSVTVVDSAGSIVMGDVEYINENFIIITFQGAFSGRAYLN